MREYLELLDDVLTRGAARQDRTGVGTLSVFGRQMRVDLGRGFPLLTTKEIHWKSVIYELLWFLRGDTNIKFLQDRGVTIWDKWADDDGELGPVYGAQWRRWPGGDGGIDQIKNVVQTIRGDPDSRRLVVSAWNVSDLAKMNLAPCHLLFQFYVAGGKLSCQLYQRSADIFLGVPFNIASYALLTTMLAQVCGLRPGEFIHTFGDLHLYQNHLAQAKTQLAREAGELPTLKINPAITDIDAFSFDDFTLENYCPHPRIKAPIAV